MKLQTKDLSGAALDWAVAKCEESDAMCFVVGCRLPSGGVYVGGGVESAVFVHDYTPSTDWSQGGPLVENGCMNVGCEAGVWWAEFTDADMVTYGENGDSALQAVCRTLVLARLGPEIEVPAELCE